MTKPINDGRFHKGHNDGKFSLAERFHQNYEPVPEAGCWIWTGSIAQSGHGKIQHGPRGLAKFWSAHRLSWILHRGQIPRDKQVNHHCDVPGCVNPNHLYLGTQSDNMQDRDRRKRGRNSRKTHCVRGHEFTDQNIYWHRKTSGRLARHCRTCVLELNKGYRNGS